MKGSGGGRRGWLIGLGGIGRRNLWRGELGCGEDVDLGLGLGFLVFEGVEMG